MEKLIETDNKIYTQGSITLGTFLGGPLAAGILIRKNYLTFGKEKEAQISIILGIILTLFLLLSVFLIPESINAKIPNAIFPAIYTPIIYFLVKKYQGKEIDKHINEGGSIFSKWKAAGVSLLSALALLISILGVSFVYDDWDMESYNKGIEHFNENEEVALQLFEFSESTLDYEIREFLTKTGIPKWKENLTLIKSISKIENIPTEFQVQNELLLEYTLLRIKSYNLILNSITDYDTNYDNEIDECHKRIDEIISEL